MDTIWLIFGLLTLVIMTTLMAWLILRSRSQDQAALSARLREDLELILNARAQNEGALFTQMREDLDRLRRDLGAQSLQQRTELGGHLTQAAQTQAAQMNAVGAVFQRSLDGFSQSLQSVGSSLNRQLEIFAESHRLQAGELRSTLDTQMKALQADNAQKLEAMRVTVDEKLQTTLEARLGASFKQVSDRLEQVHKGLGEMQALATGVGDLKRVLTNVKTRGIFGEMQLAALLEQVLTPEQYAVNIATKPGSADRVEFAVRLPGRSQDTPVWLPVDAKFPREDYERLLDAQERTDLAGAEAAAAALEARIRQEAKTIAAKYIAPPHTTDFALLFLPTEGLYAEILRRPGLFEALQRDHRVTVAGPTNLLAFLNSLQMGFRTLAIEQRSSDVINKVSHEIRPFPALFCPAKAVTVA